jgi:peroxiredoxin
MPVAALPQPMIGEAAPAFSLNDLRDKAWTLAGLRGKFVVIHYGTSW